MLEEVPDLQHSRIVPAPEAVRPPEWRNSAFHRDAGPGERRNAPPATDYFGCILIWIRQFLAHASSIPDRLHERRSRAEVLYPLRFRIKQKQVDANDPAFPRNSMQRFIDNADRAARVSKRASGPSAIPSEGGSRPLPYSRASLLDRPSAWIIHEYDEATHWWTRSEPRA